MYFKYGEYTHPAGEIDMVNMTMRRMYSQRNKLMFKRYTLSLLGHFCSQEATTALNQAAIESKVQAVESAYLDGADAVLYDDSGNSTSHQILNAECINGTRVMSLAYPRGAGGEFATGRTFQIQIQGDKFLDEAESHITSYNESIRNTGTGGRKWELVPRFIGPPIQRNIFEQTPQRWVQSGRAEGLYGWMYPPGPMLPLWEHEDARSIVYKAPVLQGTNKNLRYPTEWQYFFSAPTVGQEFFPPDSPLLTPV